MKTGLLWYDDNPKRSLAEKVRRAARRYRQKFSTPPDVCYVHPSANGETHTVDDIRIVTLPSVLLHHYWIGQEEAKNDRRNRP